MFSFGESDMPDEEFIKLKRKTEDARAWDKDSATYQEDQDLRAKISRIFSSIVIFLIVVFGVIVPLIGLPNR